MSDQQTPVQFTGKGGEYFGIWIVNLLLSIITLGIYSAWAKVRRKKYFYNNTLVDGVGFDYHANPIAILKGRIIAVVLLVAYQAGAAFNPILAIIFALLFLVALPWIVVRGLTFNARNSSHRGLRFDFDGKYGQAALVYFGYTLLIVVTLGLALPFVMQRMNKFVFDHHKFGATHFAMNAAVKDFYMIYLKILGVVLLIGAVAGLGLSSLTKKMGVAPHASIEQPQSQFAQVAYSPKQTGGFIKVADTQTDDGMSEESLRAENEALAKEEALAEQGQAETEAAPAAAEDMTAQQSADDYLKDLSPEERAEYDKQMKAFEEQLKNSPTTPEKPASPLEKIFGPYAGLLGPMFFVAFAIGLLLYMAVLFAFSAFMQSRLHNLVWNNTKLDHVGFFCNQRMRDLLWLYLSNAIVLIFTLGLATPWAQIRMARYRAEHLAITGETNWDRFVGEKKENARALGEEIADMFDVDLSFG